MKTLLLVIFFVLMTLVLSAQKKSNYEKYWQAREDSITKSQMTLSNDTVKNQQFSAKQEYIDTLAKENPNIQVNYYNEDPFYYSNNLGRFYHGGFNYWMYSDPWFYDNYWMIDNYYWNWGFGFFGYPLYFNYWSPWRYGNGNHNHYDYWNSHNYNKSHEYIHHENPLSNRRELQNKETYHANNRRSYTPSYNKPRMNTRPQYNNSTNNTRSQISTERRTYVQSNNQRQSRSYQPSTNRTYSSPSRNYNSGNVSRSSNSGGATRRR